MYLGSSGNITDNSVVNMPKHTIPNFKKQSSNSSIKYRHEEIGSEWSGSKRSIVKMNQSHLISNLHEIPNIEQSNY